MVRNDDGNFPKKFRPPTNPINNKAVSINLVDVNGHSLPHVILFITLLLFVSCSSRQNVNMVDGILMINDDVEYVSYAPGQKCKVEWDQPLQNNHKYEIRLLFYDKGPNSTLVKKGQELHPPVDKKEFSFKVKPGITIFSVRTIDDKSNKSTWSHSSDRRVAFEQKPWVIYGTQ